MRSGREEMKQQALYVNIEKREIRLEDIKNLDVIGPIDFGVEQHLNRYKSYAKDIFAGDNVLCFGVGQLALSPIPGTRRLIFVTRSPIWQGLFISTLGGAGSALLSLGIDYICIEGKSKQPFIVKIKRDKIGKFSSEFVAVSESELEKIYASYGGERGTHALQHWVYDRFAQEFINEQLLFRILAVGPAALKITYGAICSTVIQNGKFIEGLDEWAGRGGFGSVLAQAHGIVAIIYGGGYKKNIPELKDAKKINEIFQKALGKDLGTAIKEATTKYRYDPALKTGGTFGFNFASLGSWLLSFNWNSVYLNEARRKELYEKLIASHYLHQFNEEIIKPKKWKTCSEVCPAVCKKIYGKFKKDYEPYEANGPNCGIFDQRAAERSVSLGDELGFDAIDVGNIVSWIMDCIARGLLKREELGLEQGPQFNPGSFRLEDSQINATTSNAIVNLILSENEIGKLMRSGIRSAAKKLNKKFPDRIRESISFTNLAVFVPNGKAGCIAPCQYWVPAFFLPLIIQGKFLTYYHLEFHPPEKLGELAADRSIKELYSCNMGICRFHRAWSEKVVDKLFRELLDIRIDFYNHHKKLLQKIADYDTKAGACPVFWESAKVMDVLAAYLENLFFVEERGKEDPELKNWVEKFRADKRAAAYEYWNACLSGIREKLDLTDTCWRI